MTATASAPAPARRELGLAALLSALLALAFLARGFAALGERVLAPSDVAQSFSLTRVEGTGGTTNGALGDVAVQMHPWLVFNKEELAAGRIPLWNPYNGGGAPHLANYQSAVFSPFHLPFYVMSFPLALLVSAFLKLWLLLFASYLFLRELGADARGAAAGSAVLAFAAHNVFLLQYPHSGVAACTVLTLALTARWLRATDDANGPWWRLERPGLAAGIALALTAEAYAGHPEVLCFGVVLWMLLVIAWIARRRTFALRRSFTLAGLALLAAALSAPQWLPFLEYLENSAIVALRAEAPGHLALEAWPQLFFPDLFGSPASGLLPHGTSLPDYSPQNVIYTGSLSLLLAAAGLVLARRRPLVLLFGPLALAWYLVTHDVLGLGGFVHSLPVLGMVPLNRSQLVWDICIAVLAAHGTTVLFEGAGKGTPARRIALATAALLLLFLFIGGAWLRAVGLHAAAGTPEGPTWDVTHIVFVASTCVIGLACVLAPARRALTATLLTLALLAQNAWLFRDYLPLSDARTLHARTPAIDELSKLAEGRTVAVIGPDQWPPSLNLPHHIRQLANYDALWIKGYDELYAKTFGRLNNWRMLRSASEEDLYRFGVDVVLAPANDSPFVMPWEQGLGHSIALQEEILPGRPVIQRYNFEGYSPTHVWFTIHNFGRRNRSSLRATLVNEHDREIGSHTWHADELRFGLRGICRLELEVPPAMLHGWQELWLRIDSEDANSGNAYGVVGRSISGPDQVFGPSRLTIGGQRFDVALQTTLDVEPGYYTQMQTIGTFTAYSHEGPTARFRISEEYGGRLQIVSEAPGHIRLTAKTKEPTPIETSMAAYPGWKARIDGAERPLDSLQGAFFSVPLDAGEHTVELDYEPASFALGVKAALAGLVLASVWFLVSARRQ